MSLKSDCVVRKIAIMQPYFFPYIGYFQLMNSVDRFIILDDVNYINKGWINRNKFLLNGAPHSFTLPLISASQNKKISEIKIKIEINWKQKFFKTLHQAYSRAPQYNKVIPLIEVILNCQHDDLSNFLVNSLILLRDYLLINVEIVQTSRIYDNSHLKGQEKIINICKQENAANYINAIGGVNLYDRRDFELNDININFLRSRQISYAQFGANHIPWLSVLDVLMFNSTDAIKEFLLDVDFV